MANLFGRLEARFESLSKWMIALIFLGLTLLYYGNSLSNGYSLDDEFIYTSNRIATNGLSEVSKIFTQTSFDYGASKFGYRPIAILSFAIENELFGLSPKASHSINLLLYAVAVFVLYLVLLLLFTNENRFHIFLAALLFLVLPIHSELVNNIKCRDELLMILFGLLGLYFWLKEPSKWHHLLLSIFFIALSILSKKSGYIFLGIIPVSVYFKSNGSWKKSIGSLAIMLVPLIVYKFLTKKVKEGGVGREYSFVENPLFGGAVDYSKLTIILESNWFYLKNLIIPTEFVSYYGYQTLPITGYRPIVILGLLITVVLIVLSLRIFIQRKAYLFGLVVLLVSIVPFLNIFEPMVGIVAERFTTIASIGSVVFIVFGLKELFIKLKVKDCNKHIVGFVVVYSIAYLPVIHSRNTEWDSKFSVMEADLKKVPNNVILNSNLASNYSSLLSENPSNKKRSEYGKRIVELTQTANSIFPITENYFLLGSIQFIVFKDFESSERNLLAAHKMDTSHLGVLMNLANIYNEVGRGDESIFYLKNLLKKHPQQLSSYGMLARLLSERGRFNEALDIVNSGITVNGEQLDLLLSKGNIYYMMKDARNAIVWYKKVLAVQPNNAEIKNRLATLLQYSS